MSSNLIPTHIVDKNGNTKVVYRSADGKGRPSLEDRASYQSASKRIPAASSYPSTNIIYEDDFYLADPDISNHLSHARLHDDGVVELISTHVRGNILLSKEDIDELASLGRGQSIELSQGGSVRLAADDSLVFTTGDKEHPHMDDLDGYSSSLLRAKLMEWSK